MELISVFDDVLDEKIIQNTLNKIDDKKINSTWADIDSIDPYHEICYSLLEIAKTRYDLSECVGYEYWNQLNTAPAWHIDKDDMLFNKVGETSFPICSIIFYLKVKNLRYGNFIVDGGITIAPKTNRMVLLSPGIPHAVEKFNGTRISFLVNPWSQYLYTV